MTFEFTPTDDGFRIRDTIENSRFEVDVGRRVTPEPADTDAFSVPLDAAVTVDTTELRLPQNLAVHARTPDGEYIGMSSIGESMTLDPARYELETSLTAFKLYLRVDDVQVDVADEPTQTRLTFATRTRVTLGVRSHHERPTGVVTAAQDPRDLMQAISTFGSAMKTFSPERSYPTLRGHPPELAVRGQTRIPDELEPPDTGITVEMPPEYASVFTAAPLAYYFGATIEPGLEPRFLAGDVVHDFDPDSLPTSTLDLLRHCFVLDTVVRTVGWYREPMALASTLEDRVSIDRQTLFDLPVAERTARYLDVPLDATRDLLTWPTVADVAPNPLNAESLPYLAYRLAAIRSPSAGTIRYGGCCSPESRESVPDERATDVRSFFQDHGDAVSSISFVDPDDFPAARHVWIDDGIPITGSKPTLGSYLRSVDADPHDDTIDVHVVSSGRLDDSLDVLRDQYSTDGIDVTVHESPTQHELKDVLLTDIDFLHFRGEVTDDGLECLDGPLDVRILPRTGVNAFFLDGACSYRQGLALVRVGSIGGVVTTTDERPSGVCHGRIIASLLDYGLTLEATVDVLQQCIDDNPLTIVGDGDHQVCTVANSPTVYTAQPERSSSDTISLRTHFYETPSHRLGSTVVPGGFDDHLAHLNGSHVIEYDRDAFAVIEERLDEPFIVNGDIHWPRAYDPDELWDLLT